MTSRGLIQPDPTDESLLEGLKDRAARFYAEGYAIILESLCAGIFEMSCSVRGYEQFDMDLALNPRLACKLLDKFLELKLEFYEAAANELGGYVQFTREGDDVAGEGSLLVSPDSYRKYLKPRHAELFKVCIHNIQDDVAVRNRSSLRSPAASNITANAHCARPWRSPPTRAVVSSRPQ